MTETNDRPAAGGDVAARGYRDTPGHDEAAEGTSPNPTAGPDRGPERAFGADPGGRERFDAANAYGADVDPNEMGGLEPAPGAPSSGAAGARTPDQRDANAGGSGMSGQGGTAPSRGQ